MQPTHPADQHRLSAGRFRIGTELRATLGLAAPLAAANLAQMAMGLTDTIMVGRLGTVPLAAAGLGAMFYFSGGVMLQGIISAVAPLAAHAIGAGDQAAARRFAGAGLGVAALLALPFIAVLAGLDRLLAFLGYDPALAGEIGRFLRAIAWGAPAFLVFAALRSLFAACSRTRPVMAVLVICIACNGVLNWALIYGHLGAPALGMAGSGYASAINQWLIVAGLALCTRLLPGLSFSRLLADACLPSWAATASVLRLGLPIGGIMGVELGVFLAAGIMMGLLGPAALGAHQIVLNCASITFMVPLGLGQATTVRVAYELGTGRPLAAHRAGLTALTIGIGFMGLTAIVLWAVPQAIIAVYIDIAEPANRETVRIAARLLAIAAVFQVFDGMQTIAAGVLRGYKDTFVPLLLAGLGYWGIGFLAGCVLAFPLGYGAVGLWWGLALGLAVVAVLLIARLHLLAPERLANPLARAKEA